MERAVADFASRGADMKAVALEIVGGDVMVYRGDLSPLEGEPERSGLARLDVPIFLGDVPWGTVRIAFAPDESVSRDLRWMAFVALGSLASFAVFLVRILVQLDPGRAVPDRVDSAFDLFTAGVVVLDEKLRIVMANRAAATSAGRSPDDLTGLTLDDVFAWKVDEGWQAPWATTLHSGLVATDQSLRVLEPDGGLRLYSVNCAPVGDDDAGRRGVMVTLDDLTPIERRNAELAKAMRDLRRSRDEVGVRNEQLVRLATTDPPTGVANRRTMLERLAEEIERARAEGLPLSCIMSDIDHFE